MLLILDLDETLIHASEIPLEQAADFEFEKYSVYRRPHLAQFLQFCLQHFQVAVWTSSTADYAAAVVQEIFPPGSHLEFVWARRRCTPRFNPEDYSYTWSKNLSKLKRRGFKLPQVLIVDDSPEKLTRHYGNLIRIKPFEGDRQDDELLRLMPYLLRLKDVPNVRRVEKRWWRSEVGTV